MRLIKQIINRFPFLHLLASGLVRRLSFLISAFRFRWRNPGVRLIREDGTSESRKKYAQYNQDVIIRRVFFPTKTDGYFVDVGANDPTYLSNTLLFEEFGWRGLAIDPLPSARARWESSTRRAKFIAVAASNCAGETFFSAVHDQSGWEDMMSKVVDDSVGGVGLDAFVVSQITVPTLPLSQLFRSEGIGHIDYLSIDVEGHEIEVLSGVDFETVQIDVLTVENNSDADYYFGNPEVQSFMRSKGFQLYGRIPGMDDIYVRNGFSPI